MYHPDKHPPFEGWIALVTERPIVHLAMRSYDGSGKLRAACNGTLKVLAELLPYEPDEELCCRACLQVRTERRKAHREWLAAQPKTVTQ